MVCSEFLFAILVFDKTTKYPLAANWDLQKKIFLKVSSVKFERMPKITSLFVTVGWVGRPQQFARISGGIKISELLRIFWERVTVFCQY